MMMDMKSALDTIHEGTTALASADVAPVCVDDLGSHIVSMQSEMDRIRVVQSRLLAEADRHQIWKVSGHRSIEEWLAANGKTTLGAAGRQKKLGAALGKSKELADAVDNGEISPDADVLEARTPGAGRTSTGKIIAAEIVRRMCTNATITSGTDPTSTSTATPTTCR